MHYRGGGVGHTTGHNADGANHVSPGMDSAFGPRSSGRYDNMEVDAQSVQEIVQEAQSHELDEASDEEAGDEFADMGEDYQDDDSDVAEDVADENAWEDENLD